MTVTKEKYAYSKTRTPNLFRYDITGQYFLLYKLDGKQHRTPMKTTDYEVAVNWLNEKMLLVEKQRHTARTSLGDSGGPITIGDLCDKYEEKTLDDLTLTQKAKIRSAICVEVAGKNQNIDGRMSSLYEVLYD